MDALNKVKGLLKCQKIKKKKMNMIVLRINKNGELCESAPCFHCTQELYKNKYVKINKLYYSRADTTITCIKFDDWVHNGNPYISRGWNLLARNNIY